MWVCMHIVHIIYNYNVHVHVHAHVHPYDDSLLAFCVMYVHVYTCSNHSSTVHLHMGHSDLINSNVICHHES